MKVDRFVVDTNVLISAALVAGSVPAQLLGQLLASARLVFSPQTFAELESRLWRPKFDRYLSIEDRKWLLRDLQGVADWVEAVPQMPARCRDPDDEKFIHVALACDATALITGDQDLLLLKDLEGIPVLTPLQALRSLSKPA